MLLNKKSIISIGILFLLDQRVTALTFYTRHDYIFLNAGHFQKNIGQLSIKDSNFNSSTALSFSNSNESHEFLQKKLQQLGLGQHFSLLRKTSALSQLRFYGGNNSLQERFYITSGGIPLCDYQVALHTLSDGSTAMMGEIPTSETSFNRSEVFSNSKAAIVLQRQLGKKYLLHDQNACYLLDATGQLEFVWNFVFSINSRTFKALVSKNKVERLLPLSFDVKAELEALVKNPKDGELKTFNIVLSESGRLVSEYFKAESAYGENAFEANNQFSYSLDDPHFEEVQAFTHAHTMLEWFETLGYEWVGPKPLKIIVHGRPQGFSNNAEYQAAANSASFPQITLGDGDGDGYVLQNLGKDNDVIAHEFSHHVIFRTLTEPLGESVVLHEGLADFFTFMQSGDACLGESVCPIGSGACWLPDRCLRSAENDLSYLDPDYINSREHIKGQLISGILWDLAQDLSFSKVAQLAFTTTSFFLDRSGLQDFVVALFLADRQLHAGENACTIYEKLKARGLETFLTNIDCLNLGSIAPIEVRIDSGTSLETQQKSSSSKGAFCGFIKKDKSSQISHLFILLLLFIPPIFIKRIH